MERVPRWRRAERARSSKAREAVSALGRVRRAGMVRVERV